MDCPVFHFPLLKTLCDSETRQMFDDYGRLSGVFPVVSYDGTELVFQKGRNTAGPVLCAMGPILPLLLPNTYRANDEPCLGRLKESLEDAKRFIRTIKHLPKDNVLKLKKGKWDYLVSGRPSRLQNTMKTLTEIVPKFKADPFVPVVNKDYTGGCTSAFETSDTQFLCMSTGEDLDSLSLCELETGGRLEAKCVTSTKTSGRIYQVESAVINDSCFIGTRRESDCLLYTLRDKGEGIQFKRKRKLKFDSKPMSISMSPYISGECVTVTSDGLLQLWDANGSSASETGDVTARFTDPEFCACAAYSAHPRQVLVTDRTGVAVWDMRISPRSEDLFVLPNQLIGNAERFMVGRPHPKNPFYHIAATAETMLLLDHRFPKLPVLQWQHALAAPPQYINTVTNVLPDSGEDVILVSSQDHAETIAYQIDMSSSRLPPVSESVPWRMAKPEDLFGLQGAPSKTSSQVENRIRAPLIGVAAVGNKNGSGFSTVQLTSYGDLFGQKYVSGTTEMEKTWSSGPGSAYLRLTGKDTETTHHWHRKLMELFPEAAVNPTEKEKTTSNNDIPELPLLPRVGQEESPSKYIYMPSKLKQLVYAFEKNRRSLHVIKPPFADAVNEERAIPKRIDDETVDAYLDFRSFDADLERFTGAKSQILLRLWQGESLGNLIEQREAERKRDTKLLHKTKQKLSELRVEDRAESGLDKGMDETDANRPADHQGATGVSGDRLGEVIRKARENRDRQSSDDDSDVSSELECPDLNNTVKIGDSSRLTINQLVPSHRTGISEEGQSNSGYDSLTPKRLRLSSESDMDTPLTMFRNLDAGPSYATPTSQRAKQQDSIAMDASFNFPFKTPSRTPLKTYAKSKDSQKKRRSVMGF